jgi:UDP-sulfoquinovose synthase
MRICILGGDGYLGWPTSLYFAQRGHDILIIDNGIKRHWERQCGVGPLVPLPKLGERLNIWRRLSGQAISLEECDISVEYKRLAFELKEFKPDAIVHYAEQPSAPFSMIDRERAIETQRNNIVGTLNVIYAMKEVCPQAHLIKLGTMGEYGTPNIAIEEGWLNITHEGRTDRVLFPKRPGSVYHLSKVHDTANLEFACRIWGMRVTDLNQGVVYGVGTHETLLGAGLHTSFHYDAVFGTVLNRFVTQAVAGVPITVYGNGTQTRGFINILDTVRCIEIAASNRPEAGEFRVFNQVTAHHSVNDLAEMVQRQANLCGLPATIRHLQNPRIEAENHYYSPKYTALQNLGLKPHELDGSVISEMIEVVKENRLRIEIGQITPKISWHS